MYLLIHFKKKIINSPKYFRYDRIPRLFIKLYSIRILLEKEMPSFIESSDRNREFIHFRKFFRGELIFVDMRLNESFFSVQYEHGVTCLAFFNIIIHNYLIQWYPFTSSGWLRIYLLTSNDWRKGLSCKLNQF